LSHSATLKPSGILAVHPKHQEAPYEKKTWWKEPAFIHFNIFMALWTLGVFFDDFARAGRHIKGAL